MADGRTYKRLKGESQYRYVTKIIREKGVIRWLAIVLGKGKTFVNERDAAKWVDLRLIDAGKEPVNVLRRVL